MTAAVEISTARAAQVDTVIRDWLSGFLKPLEDTADFLRPYHPQVQWFDHAFQVCRVGHEAAMGLQKAFRHCNQPFDIRIKSILLTALGAVVEQVWLGRCANDIVRPSGEVAVKASGREFECHVCHLLRIDEEGKITRLDEYYNRRWDEGVGEEQYTRMGGASLRET